MKIYLKISKDTIINDCITYPYDGYVECEVDEIPSEIIGGWYKLENGQIVEYPELKPIDETAEIEQLKQQQALMQKALDDLIFGGAL